MQLEGQSGKRNIIICCNSQKQVIADFIKLFIVLICSAYKVFLKSINAYDLNGQK